MKAAVLIASACRDLAELAVRSVSTFAPDTPVFLIDNGCGLGIKNPHVVGGARDHASAIEFMRRRGLPGSIDQVICFDDDALVMSAAWLPTLQQYHREGYGIVGGKRHRGRESQSVIDGIAVPHAHCLSMRREVFEAAQTFHAQPGYDTGELACVEYVKRGGAVKVLPYTLSEGMALYYDKHAWAWLWMHLARGTSFAPGPWWRERVRDVTARWSARSQKIRRRQALRARYVVQGWERLEHGDPAIADPSQTGA